MRGRFSDRFALLGGGHRFALLGGGLRLNSRITGEVFQLAPQHRGAPEFAGVLEVRGADSVARQPAGLLSAAPGAMPSFRCGRLRSRPYELGTGTFRPYQYCRTKDR
jgi:hypothetical protein